MESCAELRFKARVNKRFKEVSYLFEKESLEKYGDDKFLNHPKIPHEFFENGRMNSILHTFDYSNEEQWTPPVELKDNILTISINIINNDKSIDKFLNWILPYIIQSTVKGHVFYEDWDGDSISQIMINLENIFVD